MKKENFITLLLGTVGGLLFALGMCMCLLPEWNMFLPGVIAAGVGVGILIVMLIIRRVMKGKPALEINAKTVGRVIFGIFGALVLGLGMCMTMVFEGMMIPGIIVGVIGILLLLCLIPLIKGLK